MLTKVNTNPNHYTFTHEKNHCRINFFEFFVKIFPQIAPAAKKTIQKINSWALIFVDFSYLISPTSLKTPFPSLNPSIYPLVKAIKGLIKQTKWLICRIQHSVSMTANHPQEGI